MVNRREESKPKPSHLGRNHTQGIALESLQHLSLLKVVVYICSVVIREATRLLTRTCPRPVILFAHGRYLRQDYSQ